MPSEHIEPLFNPDELLRESLGHVTSISGKPCCTDDAWRGRLCPYHEGFADALAIVAERIRQQCQ